MRILFVSSQYPPYELGGIEQLCHEARFELLARGHDVMVLTSRYGVRSLDELRTDKTLRTLYLTADIHYYKPLDFFLKLRRQESENLAELKRVIDSYQPDAIMFWGMFALSHNLPYWAERWMPGRVAYYIASYWPLDEDLHRAYWSAPANRWLTEQLKSFIRRFALSRLDREKYPPRLKFEHVVCCSEFVRDRLLAESLIPSTATVIYGGTDPQSFKNGANDRISKVDQKIRLLYFGRLIPDKGVHTAIEAVGLLAQSGRAQRIELTILGEGSPEYENLLRQKASEMNVEDIVHFSGKVAREDIPATIQDYDVFLFTSIWPEPFGRTIVEAMMAGLPVIGSDVGGSREIFRDYDEGLLFKPGDAQGLAERINLLISDPERYRRLSELGRRLANERFSTSEMTNRIEEFLRQVSVSKERAS